MPMITKHNHLNGIEKLKDPDYIQLAQIGDLGEIWWPSIIVSASGDVWNYDISPEYIYHCGEDMDIINKKIVWRFFQELNNLTKNKNGWKLSDNSKKTIYFSEEIP